MNVFLVASPLQLLHAEEAKHHFGLGAAECTLVVLPIQYRADDVDQLRALVAPERWAAVHFLPAQGPGVQGAPQRSLVGRALGFWRYLDAIRGVSRRVGRVERVFIGHYPDRRMRHFAHAAQGAEVYLLDDGMATLTVHARRAQGMAANTAAGGLRGVRRRLGERLLGARFGDLEHVTFFTAFDLEPGPGDRLVRNTYGYARAAMRQRGEPEGVLFLGMPLEELGVLSGAAYRDCLRQVRAHFGEETVWYAPHRAEDSAKLAALEAETGMRPRPFGAPIEWVLVNGLAVPGVLASFYSSALESCRRIFAEGLPVRAFRIDSEDIAVVHRTTIGNVYDYLERTSGESLRVIPLRRVAEGAD